MRSLLVIYILLNSLSNFAQSSPPPANDSVVWFPEILEHTIKWHPIKKEKAVTAKGDTIFNWKLDTVVMATRARKITCYDSIAPQPSKNTAPNTYERFTGKKVTHDFNCGSAWTNSEVGEFLQGWDRICCLCETKKKSKECKINKTKDYYVTLGSLCKKCGGYYGESIKIIVKSGDSRMKKYRRTGK